MRLSGCSTPYFDNLCGKELTESPLLDVVSGYLEALDGLDEQIKRLDKRIEQIVAQFYPQTMLIQQITAVGPITSLSFLLAVGELVGFVPCAKPRSPQTYVTGKECSSIGRLLAGMTCLLSLVFTLSKR
jgi:hypothetical protein